MTLRDFMKCHRLAPTTFIRMPRAPLILQSLRSGLWMARSASSSTLVTRGSSGTHYRLALVFHDCTDISKVQIDNAV